MKKMLPVLMFGLVLAVGCSKKVVKEDMAESAGSTANSGESAAKPGDGIETVPDDRVVAEDIKSGEASSAKKGSTRYKDISGDSRLSMLAQETGGLYTIHFDYDNYSIRPEDRQLLLNNAKWLSMNPEVKVQIEGYADERGETEYNLALGDKRARSVEKYLNDMGIKTERLSTISYGEENPVDPSHSEDAWARNRRAEFKVAN